MKFFLSAFFVFLLCFPTSCSTQSVYNLSSDSRRALRAFENALDHIKLRNYNSAEREAKRAISIDDGFIEAYMLLGDIYAETNRIDDAVEAYEKGIETAQGRLPGLYFIAGNFYMKNGMYRKAKEAYQKYLELNKYNRISPEIITSVNNSIKTCKFALDAMANPVPFEPINLGSAINSEMDEYSPVITADEQTMIYTRLVEDENVKGRFYEDFYISQRVDGQWQPSRNLGRPVNSKKNEGAPTLSPDGSTLIFVVCEDFDGYGPGRHGYGSCDLFFSHKIGDNWSPPRNLGRPVNTSSWESHPSFASDGRTIYFVSNRKDGMGGSDIWKTVLGDDGYWGKPQNLGTPINTSGNEYFVFIHPDNRTLYFSSDGHPGMGGLDIFMSRKDEHGQWTEPINLGYPINTAHDESSFFVNARGDRAYFASDREDGYGGFDLYYFELYEDVRPLLVTYLKGIVYDSKTHEKLEAKFELINLKTGQIEIQSYSDRINGSFLVCIPADNDYALNVSKEGYLFYSENFSLTVYKSEVEPFQKNIPLQPIEVGEAIVLRNVFFDTDKYDLKEASKNELNRLVELLKNNPTINVEISGHTDSIGAPDYNLILSENRARAVYNYLKTNNISSDRLSYKGYGDTRPIDTNTTEEGRANNRRTEFKVLKR